MMLRREEILGAKDIAIETIAVPEWGGEVLVRSLSGTQREAMDRVIYEGRQVGRPVSIFATVAAYSIVDATGARLFSDEDIGALAAKNSAPLERIWDWHTHHSGIGVKSLEEAAKNSGAGQNGAMPSGSPSVSAG
jgi:hypothetical protein